MKVKTVFRLSLNKSQAEQVRDIIATFVDGVSEAVFESKNVEHLREYLSLKDVIKSIDAELSKAE